MPEIRPILRKFADDRITLIGPVSRHELPAYFQDSDLFVFPSINDAFGMVVLEAMACGIPVITTENSCGRDIINDGVEGCYSDQGRESVKGTN